MVVGGRGLSGMWEGLGATRRHALFATGAAAKPLRPQPIESALCEK